MLINYEEQNSILPSVQSLVYANDYIRIYFVTCYLTYWEYCNRLHLFSTVNTWDQFLMIFNNWDQFFSIQKFRVLMQNLKILMLMLKKFRGCFAEFEKCFHPAHGALSVLQISANLKARTKPIVSAGSSFAERRGTIDSTCVMSELSRLRELKSSKILPPLFVLTYVPHVGTRPRIFIHVLVR